MIRVDPFNLKVNKSYRQEDKNFFLNFKVIFIQTIQNDEKKIYVAEVLKSEGTFLKGDIIELSFQDGSHIFSIDKDLKRKQKQLELSVLDIQTSLVHLCNRRGYTHMIPNIYINRYEVDLFALTKAGYSVEFEIKLTKSDFLADFKKGESAWDKSRKKQTKHQLVQMGKRVSYFYFVCPGGMLLPEEIPKGYGLIWCKRYPRHNTVYGEVILKAKKLSKKPFEQKQLNKMTHNYIYRGWIKGKTH